jgi:magnesium transporter
VDIKRDNENENDRSDNYENYLVGDLLDTKTSQLDDVLNEKLEQAFHQPSPQHLVHDVAKIAIEYDPIDLAYAVTRLPQSARIVVYENLPDFHAKIIFMINASNTTRTAIFRQLTDDEIRQLVEQMPPDEGVSMLDDLSDRRLKRILEMLEPKKAARLKELLQHGRHSAGRLMTNEFFAFYMNTTIGEVAAEIRNHPGIELTRRIFVMNDNGELAGYVPARALIVNADFVPLRQIMRPIFHKVFADASRDEVVDLVERYKIPALPVVDKQERLVGIITYETVVEAMEDIADGTIASIAGTAEDISEHEPILKRFLWRAPWLLVTLFAGLVTATAMTYFNNRIWFVFLPFFVPLITGMSGNVGIQCSTILVRGMSTGELSPGTRRQAIFKELMIGLLIGITFGILCGTAVYVLNHLGIHQVGMNPIHLGIIVSCGLLSACMTATVLGATSPFAFARLGIDPAVASGPIVTAFNDVLSTLIFFLVARLLTLFFS